MNSSNRLTKQSSPTPDQNEDFLFEDKDQNDNTQHIHNQKQSVHSHIHSEESLRRIVNRLSRIEGHIRGIKTMVQQSSPCPDVLLQIAAVRGALDRVARIVLDEHLTECIARAAKEGNIEVEIEQLKAALDRFLP
ncbi:MAG: metal-sensitive transcriptional regulator [Iphinoe sp. HA4291-MV1]|jgi:DNA-binding FrmR family transcriptional regulator|nr:metal-sensitive transcriptional regulator [Iphinoe sp. HA4291-MV1]